MKKTKIVIDKILVDAIHLAHKDFPCLSESDVKSIHELLTSEDSEIVLTGIMLLDSFNYFLTPKIIYALFEKSNVNLDIDADDMFVNMVRMVYCDSERYDKEESETYKTLNDNLYEYTMNLTR